MAKTDSRDCDVKRLDDTTASSIDLRSLVAEAVGRNEWHNIRELGKQTTSVEKRDAILSEILSHRQWQCGWQCVLQLVRSGVSCGLRSKAFLKGVEESQWHFVRQMMRMGVSKENRNSAIWTACGQCQVDIAAELIDLGVGQSDKEGALCKTVGLGHVSFVVDLLKKCGDADLTDFVLKEAVKQEQWQLVGRLTKMNMHVTQLESVCQEALASQQWDLALHLLKNCVSPSASLVDEVFQAHKECELLDLHAPGCLSKELRGLLLLSAVKYGQWDTFLRIMKQHGISDIEFVEATKVAVDCRDEDIFLNLVLLNKHTLQLFKQFCNKHPWKIEGEDSDVEFMFDGLWNSDHDQLALYVAVVNGAWSHIKFVICSEAVSTRMRMFALKRLCAGNGEVYSEVADRVLDRSPSVRRQLFLQAVRNGHFSLLAGLFGEGVPVGDVKFAIRMILASAPGHLRLACADSYNLNGEAVVQDLCRKLSAQDRNRVLKYAIVTAMKEVFEEKSPECVDNFCVLLLHFLESRNTALECALDFFHRVLNYCMKRSVIHDAPDIFWFVCYVCVENMNFMLEAKDKYQEYPVKSKQVFADIRKAFCFAVKHNKSTLLVTTYTQCRRTFCPEFFDIAVEELVKSNNWQTLKELIAESFQGHYNLTTTKHMFVWCLNQCIGSRNVKVWPECAPVLEGWLEKIYDESKKGYGWQFILNDAVDKMQLSNRRTSCFVKWCAQHSCTKLVVLICVLRRSFPHLKRVMQENVANKPFARTLLNELLDVSANKKDLTTLNSALKIMTEEDLFGYRSIYTESLLQLCRNKRANHLAVLIAFWLGKWAVVKRVLAKCQDQAFVGNIVRKAASSGHWKLVEKLMPQCSYDPSLLSCVLHHAVNKHRGSNKMAKRLMKQVNPLMKSGKWLLQNALDRLQYPTKADLEILHCCVEAGLCTAELDLQCCDHARCFCTLYQLLRHKNTVCLKLLHHSGTFSNKNFFTLKNSDRVSPYYMNHHSIDYLNFATSAPLSLQDLCRNVVSRCISCRPGREDRIQSLPVPQPVKEFLCFSDLIQSSREELEEWIEAQRKRDFYDGESP